MILITFMNTKLVSQLTPAPCLPCLYSLCLYESSGLVHRASVRPRWQTVPAGDGGILPGFESNEQGNHGKSSWGTEKTYSESRSVKLPPVSCCKILARYLLFLSP